MNLSHLRAGIIGTGFIGPVQLEALKRLGVQVQMLCGSAATVRLKTRTDAYARTTATGQ